MKRKLLGFVILALLLFVPLMLHAATAGKFTSVEGNVDVTSPGKEARQVNLGDPLDSGDIIRTKSKAKCEVAFLDGSILRLAENSRLHVNEFAQEKGQWNTVLSLFRGKIQNVVMALTGGPSGQSKYEVYTPTAIVGVRGTNFFVYHQAGVTSAIFKEGTGYGYSLNRPGDIRTIDAGQVMTVLNANTPPVIRPATAVEMNKHQKDTTPSEKPKDGAEKPAKTSASADENAGLVDIGNLPKAEELQKIVEAAVPTASMEQSGPVIVVPFADAVTGTMPPEIVAKLPLYSNSIKGDLYQQNNATIHDDGYEKPVFDNNNYFSNREAWTMYVKSQNPANLPKYGFQMAEREIVSNGVESDIFDTYLPSNQALGYTSSYNVPRTYYQQINFLSVWPDLSASPPTMPPSSEVMSYIAPSEFLGNAWPVMAPITVGTTQYAKVYEADYNLNVMERVLSPSPDLFDQTFTGTMDAYQLDGGVSSLWSTDSAHPLGLSFLGAHQDASLPLVFQLRRFFSQYDAVSGSWPAPTPDGGAYFGVLSGTLSSDRSLAAALYGLYVSPNKDGVWEAGILKTTAPLTGSSYAGINTWEAAGQIYRVPKAFNLSAPGVEAIHLLDLDASNKFVNVRFGSMGKVFDTDLYGRFNTGGPITTLVGGSFGKTNSIEGLPDFGIFEMLHGGIQNSYSNPGATWRMDMASTGQFGLYVRSDLSKYNDSGFWTASINDGALSGSDKLSGTLNGYFLTYKKEGTLTGDFLGNLKPDTATTGIWQGASAGAWEKTRDVTFSSGIVGDNFRLEKEINGYGGAGNYYYIGLNQNGSYAEAGFHSGSGSTITEINFDSEGQPGQEIYSEIVWVKDTVSGAYTLQEAKELTLAQFNTGIVALRIYQGTANETLDNYRMESGDGHDGIIAGFQNPWSQTGGFMTTNVSLIGKYDAWDEIAPAVFGGTIISFNPMYSTNPYYNITSNPNGSKSPFGGAYYGYLGAAFGKKVVTADWMDGLINGLYRDPSGSVGIFSGKFTGSNNPQLGAWTGTGTIDGGYAMGTAGSGLTEANFANNVYTSNRDWSYGVNDVVVTGDGVQMRAVSYNTAVISNSLLSPSGSGLWGVWQNRTGGTYSGNPTTWSSEAKMYGIKTDYFTVQMNTTESNGIKTGDVVGASVDHSYSTNPGNTWVLAGAIKGLFDPVQSTYQGVAQGTIMETAAFVNKVSSMNDAQRQAFTDATKIPAFTVGTTDLKASAIAGTGGNTIDMKGSYGINSAAFYASSTGGKPQIWASGNVSGGYTGNPAGVNVPLTGTNGIAAQFNMQQWTGTKWDATVTNGSVPAGTPGFTYPNAATTGIIFQGGAAGSINSTAGTFSGTAAGIVK